MAAEPGEVPPGGPGRGDGTEVGVGAAAPDFTLRDHHGEEVRLGAFRGVSPVLLVFYPFAFTGVCTGELAALRDGHRALTEHGAELLALSCDSMFALRVFAENERLPFRLLSDFWPHGEVARAYGVFDAERGCAVRGSFLIDQTGIVRWQVVNPLPEARDIADHLAALRDL